MHETANADVTVLTVKNGATNILAKAALTTPPALTWRNSISPTLARALLPLPPP